ncbi:MAGUK p55 subfamily member 4 [Tachysurus fulvidraco]|uniref:MAGUK p55 subfamily member 4 n=1 Tax=Tachysurus fulvidraco TaxID=1234273 RepID=UPI001FEF8166|nr:MAGUK p55 subfamily member 4 [Tachysurus fulvidraco]
MKVLCSFGCEIIQTSDFRTLKPAMENGAKVDLLSIEEEDLVQILSHVVEELKDSGKDINRTELLHGLLNAPCLQSLLKIYECLQQYLRNSATPYLSYASGLTVEILSDLRALLYPSYEARELYRLLMEPHMQALISAHDVVGLKDYEPVLPPLPEDLDNNEEAMRIVCMVKNNQPLGATIRRDEMTGEIYVARVIHGGLADRSGLLHAGDRLVEVNGYPVFGLEPEQIIKILAHSHGTVMFKVVPITDRPVSNKTMLFVRAMVDYNPHQDPGIPCMDAGMAFRKGTLLEIVDQTDALWWQAKKVPCSSTCAGLIPSACMLKRNLKEFWWSQPHTCNKILSAVDEEDDMNAIDVSVVETDEEAFESEELKEDENEFNTSVDGIYLAGFRRSLRVCRRRRVQGGVSGLICSLCCTSFFTSPYEDVVRYQRHLEDTHRLIALLGPSGVGVNELRKKLIEINPRTFLGPTPHTTRPRKMYEEPGREYHFLSRDQFENMVHNNRFVEYGEFRGHLYGTSVDAVKDVLGAGKSCIIDIDPKAIPSVRTPELKAYIIYIKPPPLAQMKRTRINAQVTNYCTTRPFKDEDFYELEEAGCRMEQQYSQFFDHVIVNDGLQSSCVRLMAAVRRAQEEPQWVPASWIKPTEET